MHARHRNHLKEPGVLRVSTTEADLRWTPPPVDDTRLSPAGRAFLVRGVVALLPLIVLSPLLTGVVDRGPWHIGVWTIIPLTAVLSLTALYLAARRR